MDNIVQQLGKIAETKSIEKQPRLNSEILQLLNTQINNELFASQLYYAISAWCDDRGYNHCGKFFFKQAQEEMTHHDKIIHHIYDRNSCVKIKALAQVRTDFKSIKECFEASLQHEMGVTKNWEDIANKAKSTGDMTTVIFSQWFNLEQIEEENVYRDILDLMNLGLPDWKLEQIMQRRNG